MLKAELKAELAKERDRVEREIAAWLRTQPPVPTCRGLADRIERGEYREVPPEERTMRGERSRIEDRMCALEAALAKTETALAKAESYQGGVESAALAIDALRKKLKSVLIEATLLHASECECWMCHERRG